MTKRRAVTALAVLTALSLSACGDDSDDAPETVVQTVTEEVTLRTVTEEATTPEPTTGEEPEAAEDHGPRAGDAPYGQFVEQGEDCTGMEGSEGINSEGQPMMCKDVGNATHWFVNGPGLHD